MGSDSQDIQQHLGCGTETNLSQITLNINTTTGGCFSVVVDSHTSVENLKKIVGKKLKVAKDRICLLHREKELHDGTSLKENGLMDGSKIILLPNVETGLLAQRPENTVMQALESLNDSQVNDFLSGKTPLNLSMRLGDHMMLIQLQLSTVNPTTPTSSSSGNGPRTRGLIRSRAATKSATNASPSTPTKGNSSNVHYSPEIPPNKLNTSGETSSNHSITTSTVQTHERQQTTINTNQSEQQPRDLILSSEEFENLRSIVNSLTNIQNAGEEEEVGDVEINTNYDNADVLLDQSPIKSLSNLVSSPIKTTPLKNIPISPPPINSGNLKSTNISSTCSDPISAKLTSCLCKRLDSNSNSNGCDTNCQLLRQQESSIGTATAINPNIPSTSNFARVQPIGSLPVSHDVKPFRGSSLLHRTLNNPITKTKSIPHSHNYSHRHSTCSSVNLRRSKSSDDICMTEQSLSRATSSNGNASYVNDNAIEMIDTALNHTAGINNTGTLAEASRNLTKTLRKLSKEVFTNKVDISAIAGDDSPRSRSNASCTGGQLTSSGTSSNSIGSGAVIESMRNHGRGIYSGTFSGTLNPALQDRYGRPKRDISTVIHILNDLLSATPHYSRGARISFEPANNPRSVKHTSSKRLSCSNNGTSSKEHCTKCIPSSKLSCSYGECNGHSNESTKTYTSCRRHIVQQNENLTPKTVSLPSTPTSPDCHQCHMRLTNSAPVTPTSSSPTSSINFNDSYSSDSSSSLNSTLNLNTSTLSVFDCRTNELLSGIQATSTNPICIKCSSIELENNKTKTKLDQLRLVMQQRKERREARKLKASPYGARIIGGTCTTTTNTTSADDATNTTTGIQSALDGPPTNHIVEQVDTLA